MLVHSRYRSAVPSGENRVVDNEGAALVGAGHEVVRFERDSDDIAGWPATRKAMLPGMVVWNPGVRRDLAETLRTCRPDVVHVHNTFPLLSAAVLYACRDAGVPVVATIHNYKPACPSGDFFRAGAVCHACADGLPLPALRHGCYRGSRAATAPVVLASVAHRHAWRSMVAAYIFISASQRDLLRGYGFPRDRAFVRHNLIPARQSPPPGHRDTVLYAGRLDEAKGVRLLMAGWDRYTEQSRSPGLGLIIAGSGPLGAEVSNWASTRSSVRLAGQLDAAACAEKMAAARAVILPSAWEETFGLAAVEAMSLGVPPMAAAHGSFTELVRDGVDGVLFSPGDAGSLASMLADADRRPERYAEYGVQARKSYEQRFDPEISMRRLLEIYDFAVANPACPDPIT